MSKYLLLLFSFIAFCNAQAQDSVKGRIAGKLVESGSKMPVGFASVALFSSKDSSLAGGVTSAENGQFAMENLPFGNYFLKITLVGYSPKKIPNIALTAAKPNV